MPSFLVTFANITITQKDGQAELARTK